MQNALPGSVYVVLANSDLIFNTILSRLVLKKQFTHFHYLAVVIAIVGVCLMAVSDLQNAHACGGNVCGDNYYLTGTLMALGSALASAINSVVADKVLTKDKSMVGVAEISLFNSMMPSAILWVPMLLTSEQEGYDDTVADVRAHNNMVPFVLCCVGLGISKMIDRASKFTMVSMRGAFFYAIVDSFRKVFTAMCAIWVLGEPAEWNTYVALALTNVAMGVYAYASRRKAAAEQQKLEAAAGLAVNADEPGDSSWEETGPMSLLRSSHSQRRMSNEEFALAEVARSMSETGSSQDLAVLTLPLPAAWRRQWSSVRAKSMPLLRVTESKNEDSTKDDSVFGLHF